MSTKITNPTKPSECVAALSMSEEGEEHPYASILYTSHEGVITFFGLTVTGVQEDTETDAKLLTYPMTRFNREANKWETTPTTDPDEADKIIQGNLDNGTMEIVADYMGEDENGIVTLAGLDNATTFVSIIRMVYSMEAQGA